MRAELVLTVSEKELREEYKAFLNSRIEYVGDGTLGASWKHSAKLGANKEKAFSIAVEGILSDKKFLKYIQSVPMGELQNYLGEAVKCKVTLKVKG